MGKYNLVNTGSLSSITVSGSVSLNWREIDNLHNGVTNSGIVSLTPSDRLYLELNLGERIKVDGVRLYTNDNSKLQYIDFYYKNSENESYTICSKSSIDNYYLSTIDYPSAPKFIKVVVSGADLVLHEFLVYNEDYTIGFGTDGDLNTVQIDSTLVNTSKETRVALYNNSDNNIPATAYVAVGYTNNESDKYISVSSSITGPYYGLGNTEVVVDSTTSDSWEWGHGSFDNTKVFNNKVVIDSITTSYINKITTLPYPGYTRIFGFYMNPWAYDQDSRLLYVATVESSMSSPVRLRSYSFKTNTWTFISELPTQGFSYNSNMVSLIKYNNYLYIKLAYSSATENYFGRYDLNGAQGNWEWVVPKLHVNGYPAVESCILAGNKIYFVEYGYRSCVCYNLLTDSWHTLAIPRGVSTTTEPVAISLMYDEKREVLYSHVSSYNTQNSYIDRYNIATNTWEYGYLDYVSKLNVTIPERVLIDYYDDKFYLKDYSFGNLMYVYDLTTDTTTSVDVGFTLSNTVGQHSLLTPPMSDKAEVTLLYVDIENDVNSIYGYNIQPSFDSQNYTTGYYTTPIFDVVDKNLSSYFIIGEEVTEGISAITNDITTPNGTIQVVSSDSKPEPILEIYWEVNTGYGDVAILKYNYNFDIITQSWVTIDIWPYDWLATGCTAVCRRTGVVLMSNKSRYHSQLGTYLYIYNRDGQKLFVRWLGAPNSTIDFSDGGADFTKDHGLWLFSKSANTLKKLNYDLSDRTSLDILGIYDIAVEEDGNGVWYTDQPNNFLVHLAIDGTTLQTIYLRNVSSICPASNNGCWVVYEALNGDQITVLYSSEGELQTTVSTHQGIIHMTSDTVGGFYYITNTYNGNNLFHVNAAGHETMSMFVDQPTRLKGCPVGVVVRSQHNGYCQYIDLMSGKIHKTIRPTYNDNSNNFPAIFYWDIEAHKKFKDEYGDIDFPLTIDPIWGNGANWLEVPKNGWFLPKRRYNRVKVTLQSRSESYNASLTSVSMPNSIKVQDIPAKDSKDFYIRTTIPDNLTTSQDFESRVKAWWDINV